MVAHTVMKAYVTYWLSDDNVVTLEYEATTDKPTVVNLSNHTFFNLRGSEPSYVMEHIIQVEADTCVQNNLQYCPDILLSVEDTPSTSRILLTRPVSRAQSSVQVRNITR